MLVPECAEDVETDDEEDEADDGEDEVGVGHNQRHQAPVLLARDVRQTLGVVGSGVPLAEGAAVQAGETCVSRMEQDAYYKTTLRISKPKMKIFPLVPRGNYEKVFHPTGGGSDPYIVDSKNSLNRYI